MKIRIAFFALIPSLALLFFSFLMSGCKGRTIEYLDEDPKFSRFIGQKYELLTDSYIFRYAGVHDGPLFIEAHEMISGIFPEVSPKSIGRTIGYYDIIGMVPKGSIYIVKSIGRESTFENNIYFIEIIFFGNSEFGGSRIDGRFLMKYLPQVDIDPRFSKILPN